MRTHATFDREADAGYLYLPHSPVHLSGHCDVLDVSRLTEIIMDVSDSGLILGFEFLGLGGLPQRFIDRIAHAPLTREAGPIAQPLPTIDVDVVYWPDRDSLRIFLGEAVEISYSKTVWEAPETPLTVDFDALDQIVALTIEPATRLLPQEVLVFARGDAAP